MKNLLLTAIRWYQKNISPGLPRRCRYEPTCSQYAINAIETHGAIKGTLLGSWRLLRCNPWSTGGVDWVPEPGHWPSKPMGLEELLAYRAKEDNRPVTSLDHRDHCGEETSE